MDSSRFQDIIAKTGAQLTMNHNSAILTVSPDKLRDACKLLVEELPDFYHLSTVTGADTGKTIEVYYHFWKGKEFLSLKTSVQKENPTLHSLVDLVPCSLLYEAEIKDLLGIVFEGNPLMDRKLLIPDEYPKDAPPLLRKEAEPEKLRKMMQLE